MVYLASGGFWLSASYVLITAIGFAASIAFGYLLPKEAYGNYKYILSVYAIFSIFTLTGLGTALVQSVARGFEGVLRQGVRLGFIWSLPAALGALTGAGYYFYRDNAFLAAGLVLVAIAVPLLSSWGLFSSFLNGKKDFRRMSIYALVDSGLPTLLVLGALFFTHDVLLLLCVYFGASALLALVFYIFTNRAYKPESREDPELVGYSLRLSALNVIGMLAVHLDKVIVFTTLGAVELAVYSFASAFPDHMRALLKQLNTLMIPKIAQLPDDAQPVLRTKIIRLGILLCLITVLYIIAAPYLYSLFFPKYPEAIAYSRVLALMILSSMALIPVSIFIARKQEDKLAKASIGGSLLQLLLLYPAAHFGGITGVCIARVVGSYVVTGIAYALLYQTRR